VDEDDLDFLDDLAPDVDNYVVEKFDNDEDDDCPDGACKI
jgi:hypothetical protein